MTGSIVNINPANQSQFISGGQVVVPVSGMLPVGIIGSVGSTTFVDVNSSTSADNISTGDDTLATRAFNLGYNLDNDQWTRIYSIAVNSGLHTEVNYPTSGFALFTASEIIGTDGARAEVWSAEDDDMLEADNLLQVGARLYGFLDQGTSGVWPRIRAAEVKSGIDNRFNDLSGYALQTAGLITDTDGNIANVVGNQSNDTEPVSGDSAHSLSTVAKNYGLNRSGNAWARIDAATWRSGGFLGIDASGFALVTASLIADETGAVANVTPNPNNDIEPTTVGALNVLSKNYGYNVGDNAWSRLQAVPYSGANNAETFGFAVAIASSGRRMAQCNSRAFDDGSQDDGTLLTTASLVGWDESNTVWSRIGARANETELNTSVSLMVHDAPITTNIDISRNTITNLSGGTVLPTISVGSELFIQNESGNNVMNVGGNNSSDFPHATQGFQLFGGESMTLKVRNADNVCVWAATSGERVRIFVTN